jgi:hypothetical protein
MTTSIYKDCREYSQFSARLTTACRFVVSGDPVDRLAANCGEYNPKRFTGTSGQEAFESLSDSDSRLTAIREAEAYRFFAIGGLL